MSVLLGVLAVGCLGGSLPFIVALSCCRVIFVWCWVPVYRLLFLGARLCSAQAAATVYLAQGVRLGSCSVRRLCVVAYVVVSALWVELLLCGWESLATFPLCSVARWLLPVRAQMAAPATRIICGLGHPMLALAIGYLGCTVVAGIWALPVVLAIVVSPMPFRCAVYFFLGCGVLFLTGFGVSGVFLMFVLLCFGRFVYLLYVLCDHSAAGSVRCARLTGGCLGAPGPCYPSHIWDSYVLDGHYYYTDLVSGVLSDPLGRYNSPIYAFSVR